MIQARKLREMLSKRFDKIKEDIFSGHGSNWARESKLDEEWTVYLNGIDCLVLTEDDIREDFENIANNTIQGRVCVRMPNSDSPYILIPKELADKALLLGDLPDSWFPEGK